MMRMRSPTLYALSTIQTICFIGWFVVEVIAHSLSGQSDSWSFLETSNQLFMYTSLLAFANIAACWYADFIRTRASRAAAFTVTTFTTFAWIYNLWFVIPAFRDSTDASNGYCNGTLSPVDTGRFCDLYRAASAFSTIMAATMFVAWCYTLVLWFSSITPEIPIPTEATILAPQRSLVAAQQSGAHNADVNWRTELTEPDDLELIKIAANSPQAHHHILRRINMTSYMSSAFTALSVIGWIVLTCSLIDPAREYGLAAWDTTPANVNRLGDPIVSRNWYWLTASLGMALALSSNASYRRNRGVIGAAWLVSSLSCLQWFSLFVYSARRVHLQSDNTNTPLSDIGTATNSQYAEVAGIGLIAVSETLRAAIMFARYMTYMLVTKLDHDRVHVPSHVDAPTVLAVERDAYNPNYAGAYNGNSVEAVRGNQNTTRVPAQEVMVAGPSYDPRDQDLYVPSYNMSIFHGSSKAFKVIFGLQAITLVTWFLLQLVLQSYDGLFSNYTTASSVFNVASNYDRSYYFTEIMFLLSTTLVLAAYIPAFHAEREMSVASAASSFYASTLSTLGFFLLVWPFAYETCYGQGTLYREVCDNGRDSYCRMTQAAGILALINAAWLFFNMVHSIYRLAERRAHISVMERSIHNLPTIVASLIPIGMAIWAFTTLYHGLWTSGVLAQMQSIGGYAQLNNYAANPVEAYFASQAFLIWSSVTASVVIGVYASKLVYAWQSWAWRSASFFASMLPAAFLVPLIITAARAIHLYDLSTSVLALCCGIIILSSASTFYFACYPFMIHTAFYAAGPTGAAIPPNGSALNSKHEYIQKHEHGLVKDLESGAVAGSYEKNGVYDARSAPAVNPRTGDVALSMTEMPVTTDTTVNQTAVPQQHLDASHFDDTSMSRSAGAYHSQQYHQQPIAAGPTQVYEY